MEVIIMKKYNEPQAVIVTVASADIMTSSPLQAGDGENEMRLSFGGFTFGN